MNTLITTLTIFLFVTSMLATEDVNNSSEVLSIQASFVKMSRHENEFLSIQLTNNGKTPLTMLTSSPGLSWSSTIGNPSLFFMIDYPILTIDPDNRDKLRTITSIVDYKPVTLLEGESTIIKYSITDTLHRWHERRGENLDLKTCTIQYSINNKLADKFGLWSGKIQTPITVVGSKVQQGGR